ncbi:MAG: ATP-binding protein [Actinomycetota bacterium]
MSEALKRLELLLKEREGENVEFKEAKQGFDFGKLAAYCVALANERGGKLVLGITDKRPRRIVGSNAFANTEQTKRRLLDAIHMRVEIEELWHPDGRVLIFRVPSRPKGVPLQYDGRYLMRSGSSLAPMSPDMLRRIFDENVPDFSAEICERASIDDLDTEMIERFRELWIRKSGNADLEGLSEEQLLADAELVMTEGITYAALILFGKRRSLGRLLPDAEVIYEYRSSMASGPAQQREEFRQGFFSFYDQLWKTIDLRNDVQHYQDGLFMWDIPTLNEAAVREALLNAVSHRDYRMGGSIFVRQYPEKIELVSPGGLPPGITLKNILREQAPRNRRIAEAFAKCGFVERAGQGMNRIFEACIREGKPKPDFTNTDDNHFWITLHGTISNPDFLRFLEEVGSERLASFSTYDLLAIDHIFREERLPEDLRDSIPKLLDHGVIERVGSGRGTRYIPARRFYEFLKSKGVYTRRKGLDRETNKSLLLKHIRDNKAEGSKMSEFYEVLPGHSRQQIQSLLRELVSEGKVYCQGKTKGARWYPKQGVE